MIADALGQGAPVGVVGSVAPRRELAGALASVGVTAKLPAGEWSNATECAESLAAQFAGSDLGPVLRGEDSLIVEQSRARTRTWQMAGVAAMLFVLAAAIELWGVHHQLALVRAERARIRPEIASTMVGRTTVDAAYRHLTTLNDVAQTAPRWSSVIASVSDALPDEAYLMALRTRDDSVVVDGLADHAARVFDALETAKGLTGVRAAAAVRRELQDDGTVALEHFTIAARVATPAPSTTLPASNTPPRGPNR
jgi:Fimbrial assembly protein (PilN).